MTECEALRQCRSCGGAQFIPVLDLGSTPLANRLRSAEELDAAEPIHPLRVVFCPHCALLQLDHTVHPEVLFSDYLYFSSVSPALLQHAADHAHEQIEKRKLGPHSLVVEAASNDGYLLRNFVARGIPALGIEPARNIAAVARENGIETLNEFFDRDLGVRLARAGQRADLFLANNVLAHVPDTTGFVAGVKALLAPDGRAVIEAPYAKDMIDHVEFDTIYHEHLCYFTLTALDNLFRNQGLEIVDVERVAIHGGTLRFTSAHAGAAAPAPAVAALLAEEKVWGADRVEAYLGFASQVEELKSVLNAQLRDLKGAGKRIAAYGASAKGSTLLNYCGIGSETLEFVVDRSAAKQGKLTPGTGLRIYAPEKLIAEQPDYTLLLTWNFADEILRQQSEYRRRGGKFIVPVPVPRVA